jgi:hypothetical protein
MVGVLVEVGATVAVWVGEAVGAGTPATGVVISVAISLADRARL